MAPDEDYGYKKKKKKWGVEQYIIKAKLFLVSSREIFTAKINFDRGSRHPLIPNEVTTLPARPEKRALPADKFNFRIQIKDIGLLLYYICIYIVGEGSND